MVVACKCRAPIKDVFAAISREHPPVLSAGFVCNLLPGPWLNYADRGVLRGCDVAHGECRASIWRSELNLASIGLPVHAFPTKRNKVLRSRESLVRQQQRLKCSANGW